jgi:hypothetical protein
MATLASNCTSNIQRQAELTSDPSLPSSPFKRRRTQMDHPLALPTNRKQGATPLKPAGFEQRWASDDEKTSRVSGELLDSRKGVAPLNHRP